MYKVIVKEQSNAITICLYENDNRSLDLKTFLQLSFEEAKMLRLWLNGMTVKSSFECTLSGKELYFNYIEWFPLRKALNEWYEVLYA